MTGRATLCLCCSITQSLARIGGADGDRREREKRQANEQMDEGLNKRGGAEDDGMRMERRTEGTAGGGSGCGAGLPAKQ